MADFPPHRPDVLRDEPLDALRAPPRHRRRIWILVLVLLCIAAGGAAYYFYYVRDGDAAAAEDTGKGKGKGKGKGGANSGRPVPILATPVRTADIAVYLTGLGTVTPLATVTVRSRVDGQLLRVLFREGEFVKAGQLLAEIDPRPFQVQLTQAQGQLAKDQALLKNAMIDLERYRTLFEQDSIAKQQLDTQASLVRQYEATIKADQGAVDSARLQLTYSRVTAPLSGRIGLRQVDVGNIVRASDTNGIIVITQLQPISALFTIPEDSVSTVMRRLRSGDRLSVDAWDRADKNKLASGTLVTVDNQIDPATGTVKLRAQFPNNDYALFPNQFVNARMLVDTLEGATVVPNAAVQRGAQGTFVYVVKADNTVTVRPVKLGPAQGELVSVQSGLRPGEQVVTDGADRLREGARVEIADRSPRPELKGKGRGERGGKGRRGEDGAAGQDKGAAPDKAAPEKGAPAAAVAPEKGAPAAAVAPEKGAPAAAVAPEKGAPPQRGAAPEKGVPPQRGAAPEKGASPAAAAAADAQEGRGERRGRREGAEAGGADGAGAKGGGSRREGGSAPRREQGQP